jgi:regulator of sigma D
MGALPAPKPSPLTKEAQKIKSRLDALIVKMQKEPHFTPTRDQLDDYAEQLIDYINQYHTKTAPHESHLKAAIIDLTEVPQMSPQMQRIAFLTALKDATQRLELFISCY